MLAFRAPEEVFARRNELTGQVAASRSPLANQCRPGRPHFRTGRPGNARVATIAVAE